MKKNKKGFTLVELLAVIVILAIIMIIATQSVGKTVTRSRTQAFESNMDLAVKTARNILQLGEQLETDTLKSKLGYSSNEYNYKILKAPGGDGYLLEITSNPNGKFNKVDFSSIEKNKNYSYYSNVGGDNGKNKISIKLKNDSSSAILKDNDEKIIKEERPPACGKKEIKSKYDIGDIISFCNYLNGDSQKFYVINDSGNQVTAISEHPLDINNNGVLKQTISDKENDKKCSQEYFGYTNKNCQEFTDFNTTSVTTGIITQNFNYGYWVHKDFSCSSYETSIGRQYYCNNFQYVNDNYKKFKEESTPDYSDYPVFVYDNNSQVKSYVDKYMNELKSSYYVGSVEGRLIKYSELKKLGCVNKNCTDSGKPWLYSVNYWTGTAASYNGIYSVHTDGDIEERFRKATIRPVITIDKSEL